MYNSNIQGRTVSISLACRTLCNVTFLILLLQYAMLCRHFSCLLNINSMTIVIFAHAKFYIDDCSH